MQNRKLLLAIVAAIASAALSYFGTGLHPIWWLLWLAPVPVFAIAPHVSRSIAFLIALVAWFIGGFNQWSYLSHAIELPTPIVVLALGIPAVVFGLGVLFARAFLRAGSLLLASLAFPSFWVAYEYLTEIGSPHSTFGNLAYTQMDCLPLIQFASITGVWGISFIVFLFSATVAALLSGIGESLQRRDLAIGVGIVICAVFLFGEWRLRSTPAAQSVTVTLMAKDVPMSVYLGSEQQALTLLREYADEIRRTTPAGTQVIVLPEKIARVPDSALPEVDALFSSAAADTHSAIVLGLVRRTATAAFNESRFYSSEGKLQASYDKHHLIPRIEPERPGTARVLLDQPSGRWGLQICKDMDFPGLSREYGSEGASLLLVPAWDFKVDAWLHGRMAILRAVENGFALARSARYGHLTLNDNRGRILAETASAFGRFASITGTVNIVRETTLYTRFGDWFAWINVTVFVILLVSRFLPRRHNSPHPLSGDELRHWGW
jgi:apolipoprotein N-acyltransferase